MKVAVAQPAVTTSPPASGPPTPVVTPPTLTLGKVTVSRPKGTASVAVTVGGSGVLTLRGASIVPVSLATGGGTTHVVVKPTAAVRRVLRHRGKAVVLVVLTITDAQGRTATSTVKVTLRLKRH